MENFIEFFKREAKKVHKGKTNNSERIYAFFKKEKPTLMQVQYMIAKIAGARRWEELKQENIEIFKQNIKNFN